VTPYSGRWQWLLITLLGALGAGLGFMKVNPFILVAFAFLALVLLLSTTLDRYVLSRFTTTLAGCAVSFFTLFAVYEFVNLIDDLVERDLPVTLALRYLEFRSPWILAQILPISCLVATMLAFGVMTRFNEVTATKASGISIYRLATPVVLVTLALCTLAYVNHDSLLPYSNRKAIQIKDVIRGRSPRSYQSRQQRWVFGEQGRLYNYKNYVQPPLPVLPAANAGTFQGFSVYYLEPSTYTLLGRIYAREASHNGSRWVLREGWKRDFSNGGESFETFAEKEFDFAEGPGYFIREWKTPEQMSFTELRRFVRNLRQRGYDAQELTVDMYGKTAFPLLPLTMVIVALPFCFRGGKRGSLYGVGIAIALVALFLLVFSTTNALGGIGLMPPFLAAWAPNLLFAGSGIYMLLRSGT
jgi:LPS export ABC transporter permease LptG